MADQIEWTEITPGEEYRTEVNGVTYGVVRKSWNVYRWTVSGGGMPTMETGENDSVEEAKKVCEAFIRHR